LSAAAGEENPFSAHSYEWTNPAAHSMYTNENEATLKDVKAHFPLMKNPSKIRKI
jgi:hypothetical protein